MDSYDIVVVGGGIHGAGVAQAAAAHGYAVLLLEQRSPAAGTSSRSSKLIHGGLRYLESAAFGLVRESLRERELLLRLAPGLVERQRFFIPVYPGTSRRPWLIRTGLSMYALLAGLGREVRFQSLPRAQWDDLDGLRTEGLQAVFQYWDAQTDDVRLTQAVIRSAESLGARCLWPAAFVRGNIKSGGCRVVYRYQDRDCQCTAQTVVNAAGPWAVGVLQRFAPPVPAPAVENIQGTHLELQGGVERGCYYLEVPEDRRAVFLIPWHDDTALLGTTEHRYQGDPGDVAPLPEEIDYLLKVYRHYFPRRPAEVLAAWAGLRVLPATQGVTFKRSRETRLEVDDRHHPRVLSIFGGKLTGYRATAEKVIKRLRKTLPTRTPVANTSKLPLRADD
jgi:glycerol-3-phosphate dehydrogenase